MMFDPFKDEKLNQILQKVEEIHDLAESENRDYTNEEMKLLIELGNEQRKIMCSILENPLAV